MEATPCAWSAGLQVVGRARLCFQGPWWGELHEDVSAGARVRL